MNKLIVVYVLLLISVRVHSQVTNTGIMDTIGGTNLNKITIGGYVDTYFGGTLSKTENNNIPYFVSMARNNELSVNLAYLDLRYNTKNVRARVVPGFGTYMNANYSGEPVTLKNIVEASAGIKLSEKYNIWIDAGVLGSPYTNESAISKDHLMYTRSLAPEYVPYYLSGLKLTVPVGKKINIYFYLINGWQQIQDNNQGKSIGTQFEYRPDDHNLFNWNTYIGDERSLISPEFRMRYFTDFYWIYNKNDIDITSSVYIGNQKKSGIQTNQSNNIWWQSNFIIRYSMTKTMSFSARVEYFNDDNNIQVLPVNPVGGFRTFSGGLCFNVKIDDNAMFRLDGRHFISQNKIYNDRKNTPSNNMTWLVSNITLWF